ncbi:MAG: polysaccharide biosynthesis protein [Acidobacteriaceae bacterium]
MLSSFSAPPSFWSAILGRAPDSPQPAPIPSLAGQTILVTGAGGYIGSRMTRLFADSGARLVLLEIAEPSLFDLHTQLTAAGDADRCIPVIGSVCDRALLATLFDEHRPDLVLHAAALKHVPLMEQNPLAALATNALGTWTLTEIAADFDTPRMLLISTDKAVAPHSIMGASKRIAEQIVLAHPGFTAVRLVNVLGSPASVGPIFADQIAHGGPVTVTHPDARRFFLTLDEVAALLTEAIDAHASGLLIPDPGEPLRITDLARRMITALRPNDGPDIPIVFTTPRPGDKLDESLLSAAERDASPATPSLRRVLSPSVPDLRAAIRDLESAIAARALSDLLRAVLRLVPDYEPSALLRESFAEFGAESATAR